LFSRAAEDLPVLVLPPMEYEGVLAPAGKGININNRIMDLYLNKLLPGWCQHLQLKLLGGGCSIGRIMTGRGIEQWLIGRVGWGWHAGR